jgi:hypothetical protein
MADLSTPAQRARFVSSVRGYFFALVWEATNRAAGRTPPLDDYVRMRQHTGAVLTSFALVDMAAGYEVPQDVVDGAGMRALIAKAVNAVCWANDIYSHRKEADRGQDVHNLPAVLAHHHRCSPEQALHRAVEMHDAEIRSLIDLEARIQATGVTPEQQRYLSGLRTWIRGNLDWSLDTARYA